MGFVSGSSLFDRIYAALLSVLLPLASCCEEIWNGPWGKRCSRELKIEFAVDHQLWRFFKPRKRQNARPAKNIAHEHRDDIEAAGNGVDCPAPMFSISPRRWSCAANLRGASASFVWVSDLGWNGQGDKQAQRESAGGGQVAYWE